MEETEAQIDPIQTMTVQAEHALATFKRLARGRTIFLGADINIPLKSKEGRIWPYYVAARIERKVALGIVADLVHFIGLKGGDGELRFRYSARCMWLR